MLSQLLTLMFRHGLTAGAGYLVAKGVIDASQADVLIGSGMALAGVGLSIIEKKSRLGKT